MAQAQAAQYRLLVAPAVELVVRVGLCRSLAGLVHLPAEVCVCRVAPAALAAVVPSPSALPMAVQRVAVVPCLCSRAHLRLVRAAR